MPDRPSTYIDSRIDHGAMFKGRKGFLVADFESRMLLPYGDEADMTYYKPRTQETASAVGHFQKQWIDACNRAARRPATSVQRQHDRADAAGPGGLSRRQEIRYDGAEGRVTNCPEANDLLRGNTARGGRSRVSVLITLRRDGLQIPG